MVIFFEKEVTLTLSSDNKVEIISKEEVEI